MNVITPTAWTQPDPPPGYYTSQELMARARITYRQLDYWTRTGRLQPAHRADHHGTGYPRYYPADQVALASLMGRLSHAGLAIEPAHRAAQELLTTGSTRIAGITLHLPQDA